MGAKPEFEQLVKMHSGEIFAYLWRLLQDNDDAEDCLQDTFLRAYRAYARLPDDANCRAWLYKIASNVAKDQFKRRGRQNHNPLDEENDAPTRDAPVADQVEERLTLKEVHAAVDALPAKQRAALMLRKYQELSYGEIAETLDISEEAARANVYQGLKALRVRLSVEAEG